jgi:hypothetical protein
METKYMPLISPKRTSIAMARALDNFQIHCSLKGIGCASEQEIRDYISERFGPELAAKFKTSYLVPVPSDRR